MLTVNVHNNTIALKDIRMDQLGSVLGWYNRPEDFRYATGTEGFVPIEALERKIRLAEGNEREFFVGIHSLYENRVVGFISGRLAEKVLWINIIAVGPEFQGKGYGSTAVDLLLKYISSVDCVREAFLAVADKNIKGCGFWLRNGFQYTGRICSKALADGTKYNVMIMQKRL